MSLHHDFIRTAKKFGPKKAIIDKATDRTLSYNRTLIASLILSNRINRMKDCYIGIMVPTSAGAFLSVLSTVMIGKIPVMINYSTGAADNCNYAREKCGFHTIITSRALLEKINCPLLPGMICLEDILPKISTAERVRALIRSKLPTKLLLSTVFPPREDDVAVILFTSGSEREPKAVQLSHRNIKSNIADAARVYKLTDKDSILSILPLFHVFGHSIDFWLPMTTGMSAITYANPLDYKKIPVIIREEKPTIIAATPVFFGGYLREASPGDFESLRLIVAGADKVHDWIREQFHAKHGKTILEGYGTTETSPVISTNTPEHNRPGSIGKPLPSVDVRIVDIQTGQILPAGHEGKITVKGDLVMKGYLNDVEETSLRIKGGWYDTGDMGVLDEDGFLWHRGRLKRFVKIGGEMVSLVKVETELESLLPSGTDCCVVDIPDQIKGARLCAAVTNEVNDKEIIRQLRKKLPTICIPSTFLVFGELPKMGSGKVDFRRIAVMVRERLSSAGQD